MSKPNTTTTDTQSRATTTSASTNAEQESSSGDSKFDALQKALKEKGISTSFNTSDEAWRKRALKDDYPKFKETHQWLYDQPITPKTKEEQEAEKKSPEETTSQGKVKA